MDNQEINEEELRSMAESFRVQQTRIAIEIDKAATIAKNIAQLVKGNTILHSRAIELVRRLEYMDDQECFLHVSLCSFFESLSKVD